MTDDTLAQITSTDHNAGQAPVPTDLAMTRAEAQALADAFQHEVRIFRHIGGRHPTTAKAVAATGQYMWRDVHDVEGRAFPLPRFWEVVETVSAERGGSSV